MQQQLCAVVAEERLEQQVGNRLGQKQVTRSDFLLLQVPGQDGWIPFRDVFEVNGKPVPDREGRLQRLFLERPATAMQEAEKIAKESSRYNIGQVTRTVNVPTFPLIVLKTGVRGRFDFTLKPAETIDGTPVVRVNFVEKARPTLVRSLRGEDALLDGALWLDEASGRVVKALIKTVGTPEPGGRVNFFDTGWHFCLLVTYRVDPALSTSVPAGMFEYGVSTSGSLFVSNATYSNFRRFEVKTSETFKPSKRP